MEEEKKKFNPYIIIIVILVLAVAALAYNQWGKRFLPGKSTNGGQEVVKPQNIKTEIFKDDIQIGNSDAPVTIIEYYSYLCAYCKQFEDETKAKIVENYITTGKAKLILRPFPPHELGQAVLCANDQNKFLEYHDYLFKNAANIKQINDLKTFAVAVGINGSQFNECLDSGKYKARAEAWYNQGTADFKKANIPTAQQGTPAFFINGEPLIGALSYEKFAEVIDKQLTK